MCNARSLNNKMDELEVLIKQNNVPIAIISECWDITEETARIKGYRNYLNTRRDRGIDRRGGGVGLYIRDDLPSKLLSSPNDSSHEIVWVECRPAHLSRRFSCLIVASVYYPESAGNRKELIEHIQVFVDRMRHKYTSPAFVIAGDFNQTSRQWVSSVLDMKQVVNIPTHQSGSTLDMIFTNLADLYNAPRSLGPLQNSDHFIIFWEAQASIPRPKRTKTTIRPITMSSIAQFGRWIGTYDFEDICAEADINVKVSKLNSLLLEKFHDFFPIKVITVCDTDKPWITRELKQMIKTRCSLHKAGDQAAAASLRNRIVKLNRLAQRQYVKEKITPLLHTDPHKWHSSVKTLAGKSTPKDLRLLKDDGTLTSATEVNNFFSGICTTYPSITNSEIESIIADTGTDEICEVSEYAVFKELQKLKVNCASYPGELPVKLLREFSIFLAKPLSSIINQCFREQVFPSVWKRAYVRVIPKVKNPKSCDQLRPISIVPNLSKVAESFIYRELMSQVQGSLDPYQYGCLKGSSTTVYLVRLYHLIVEWLDQGGTIVDLLLADYRKAFDLIRHYTAVNNLKVMGACRHILLLIIDFLRDRLQSVYGLYPGDTDSEWSELTCGAPQGTKLAALLFLAVINFVLADFDERFKFVDDLSTLLKYLIEKSQTVPQFSESFIDNFRDQCSENSLQINETKTKILRFNPLKRDFQCPPPPYQSVSSAVILGVTFSVDCSFSLHVQEVVKKANCAMRTLLLMRRFGFSVPQLKTAYLTYIRPILEYACPVWGPQVQNTAYMSEVLESVQKRAVKAILSDQYTDYESALSQLNLPSLHDRRFQLICKFGQFLLTSDKHRNILPPMLTKKVTTRSKATKLAQPKCRTNRFSNSFVPFYVSVYNK